MPPFFYVCFPSLVDLFNHNTNIILFISFVKDYFPVPVKLIRVGRFLAVSKKPHRCGADRLVPRNPHHFKKILGQSQGLFSCIRVPKNTHRNGGCSFSGGEFVIQQPCARRRLVLRRLYRQGRNRMLTDSRGRCGPQHPQRLGTSG